MGFSQGINDGVGFVPCLGISRHFHLKGTQSALQTLIPIQGSFCPRNFCLDKMPAELGILQGMNDGVGFIPCLGISQHFHPKGTQSTLQTPGPIQGSLGNFYLDKMPAELRILLELHNLAIAG